MGIDILINCPGEAHKKERFNSHKGKIAPVPKILFVASPESVGKFKIQCPDNECRRHNKSNSNGKYNSWYEIVFNGLGGYSVEPLPKQEFKLEKVPVVVIGD